MVNQLNRVDVLSNNLANSNTNGYKQEALSEGSFNAYLRKAQEKNKPISKEVIVINEIPKIDNKYINERIGPQVITGNKLDFAISKNDLFFKIQHNNNILYSRDGAFKILDGYLVNKDGDKVLDTNDNEIIATEENIASKIALVKIDYKNLKRIGDNNYKTTNKNNQEDVDNSSKYLLQGTIEKSNVNSVLAMVSLIDSQRRFDQAQRAISGIDELNSKLIDKIGGLN
jgi:flagellar basal-body rod protein FlgG